MLTIVSDSSIVIESIKIMLFPLRERLTVTLELSVDFKGGNEMICWQTQYKRPKRLHYDFLPDFIVQLTGFDYKRK